MRRRRCSDLPTARAARQRQVRSENCPRRQLYREGSPGRSTATPAGPLRPLQRELPHGGAKGRVDPFVTGPADESRHLTGRNTWVELLIGHDSHDHLISAEELMRGATGSSRKARTHAVHSQRSWRATVVDHILVTRDITAGRFGRVRPSSLAVVQTGRR